MAKTRLPRTDIPVYEAWRFTDSGYHIIKRTSRSSADDAFIAKDLTAEEMWAIVKLIEQPAIITVETKPYETYEGEQSNGL